MRRCPRCLLTLNAEDGSCPDSLCDPGVDRLPEPAPLAEDDLTLLDADERWYVLHDGWVS